MASNKELSNLFQALAMRDLNAAVECAQNIVRGEEQKGHFQSAKLLSGSLKANRGTVLRSWRSEDPARRADSSTSLTILDDGVKLEDLELPLATVETIKSLVKESHYQDRLKNAGLPRRKRLLFFGASGCGKSATAKALARETDLPVYIVKFDELIGAYLGQTAMRLREVFKFAETNPCILLFDEVDAMAKSRGNPSEVGELDRIVIAFMQELEHTTCEGFIVATSNMPQSLDTALKRRFDVELKFDKPSKAVLKKYVEKKASLFNLKLTEKMMNQCLSAPSFAQAEILVQNIARNRILNS